MLDKKTVEKVAGLARLKMSETEIEDFTKVLSAVLENFEQISKVNTDNVKPLVTPTDMALSLRPDQVEAMPGHSRILDHAPETTGRLFRVPPVV